jgi:hypothetical protein
MPSRQHWTTKFTAHPAAVGESYGEHFTTAMGFSLALLRAALVCAVHAVLPFLFEKTGSECIRNLHGRMVTHRGSPLPNDLDDSVNSGA